MNTHGCCKVIVRIVGVLQQPWVPKLLQERLVLRAKRVGTVAVDTAARPWVLDEDRPAVGTLVDWCTQGCSLLLVKKQVAAYDQ